MLAQAAYAYICVLKESWPEMSIFSFLRIMLGFNYYHKDIAKNKQLIERQLGVGDSDREAEAEKLIKAE
jgi:hypothetical protein